MSYMTISSQENHRFSLCSYFHAHPTTLLLKILGGPMHGPSPPQIFLGDRPPAPLGLRPCQGSLLPEVATLKVRYWSTGIYTGNVDAILLKYKGDAGLLKDIWALPVYFS